MTAQEVLNLIHRTNQNQVWGFPPGSLKVTGIDLRKPLTIHVEFDMQRDVREPIQIGIANGSAIAIQELGSPCEAVDFPQPSDDVIYSATPAREASECAK